MIILRDNRRELKPVHHIFKAVDFRENPLFHFNVKEGVVAGDFSLGENLVSYTVNPLLQNKRERAAVGLCLNGEVFHQLTVGC